MKPTISFLLVVFNIVCFADYELTTFPDYPGPARDDAIAFSIGNTIYFGTGNHGGFNESNDFYAINYLTGDWHPVAEFPSTKRQYASACSDGYFGYVIGGVSPTNYPLSDIWIYVRNGDYWVPGAPLSSGGRWSAVCFALGDYIYYGTGRDTNNVFNEFWRYHRHTSSWTQMASMPVLPRYEAVSFTLYDQAYVGLGVDCTGTYLSDFWKYDPENDSWSEISSFPGGARTYASAASLDGHAYVGTGQNENGEMFGDFWVYSPDLDSWELYQEFVPARRGMAACSIPHGGAFFIGGLGDDFLRRSDGLLISYISFSSGPSFKHSYNSNISSLNVSSIEPGSTLKVFDISGQLIIEQMATDDHVVIDMQGLAKGVYILTDGHYSSKILVP